MTKNPTIGVSVETYEKLKTLSTYEKKQMREIITDLVSKYYAEKREEIIKSIP